MSAKKLLLALLVRSIIASPVKPRDGDLQIASIIASANVPKYTPPTTATREITEWLAIGDSFAAGISADVPNDQLQWSCSRFKKSYPNQMNQNSRLPGDPNSRKFTFGACSGDKIQDLLDNQLKQGESNSNEVYPAIGKPQIGTVSISGNDMKFGDVSIHPFVQWYRVHSNVGSDRQRLLVSLAWVWRLRPSSQGRSCYSRRSWQGFRLQDRRSLSRHNGQC